jgi:hypothetical protein
MGFSAPANTRRSSSLGPSTGFLVVRLRFCRIGRLIFAGDQPADIPVLQSPVSPTLLVRAHEVIE